MKDIGFESWGMEFVFNDAIMIDISESDESKEIQGVRYTKKVTKEHIMPHIKKIEKKDALIIRTGYDTWIEKNKRHILENIPYIDKSAIELISKMKKLKVIGIDSLTIDNVAEDIGHRKFKNKMIVECLVNLSSIPKKHRKGFSLQTSPIVIVGATGGPILAYAYIPI